MTRSGARLGVGRWLLSGALLTGCAVSGEESEPGWGEDEPGLAEQAQTAEPYSSQFEVQAAIGDACTGKPGSLKGASRQSVQVGFSTRNFVFYAPANLDPNQPTPLVIVPHGFTMSGDEMSRMTGWKAIADREGLVAVFPDGGGVFPWNVGQNVNGWGAFVGAGHSDQGFIDKIKEFVAKERCLDEKHIFVTGFSMGGYFSNELACTRDDIAAIGPHSGGSHDLTQCTGSTKPVIIHHGDMDPLIYYEVGLETRDRWVKRNGCSKDFDAVKVKGGTCEYYKSCKPGGQVALCHYDFMGHAWAGGVNFESIFIDITKESASELSWAFFKKYAW